MKRRWATEKRKKGRKDQANGQPTWEVALLYSYQGEPYLFLPSLLVGEVQSFPSPFVGKGRCLFLPPPLWGKGRCLFLPPPLCGFVGVGATTPIYTPPLLAATS